MKITSIKNMATKQYLVQEVEELYNKKEISWDEYIKRRNEIEKLNDSEIIEITKKLEDSNIDLNKLIENVPVNTKEEPYFTYSIIIACLFALLYSIPSFYNWESYVLWLASSIGPFIFLFAVATFFSIPVQILSSKTKFSKILFFTMLVCCVLSLFRLALSTQI